MGPSESKNVMNQKKAVVLWHYRNDRNKSGHVRSRVRTLMRIVTADEGTFTEFPDFTSRQRYDWVDKVTWTKWAGTAKIDGQDRHVVGWSCNGEVPAVWAASIDGIFRASDIAAWQWYFRVKEYSKASLLERKYLGDGKGVQP